MPRNFVCIPAGKGLFRKRQNDFCGKARRDQLKTQILHKIYFGEYCYGL